MIDKGGHRRADRSRWRGERRDRPAMRRCRRRRAGRRIGHLQGRAGLLRRQYRGAAGRRRLNAHSAELAGKARRTRDGATARDELEENGQLAIPLGAEAREDLITAAPSAEPAERPAQPQRTDRAGRALVITDFAPPDNFRCGTADPAGLSHGRFARHDRWPRRSASRCARACWRRSRPRWRATAAAGMALRAGHFLRPRRQGADRAGRLSAAAGQPQPRRSSAWCTASPGCATSPPARPRRSARQAGRADAGRRGSRPIPHPGKGAGVEGRRMPGCACSAGWSMRRCCSPAMTARCATVRWRPCRDRALARPQCRQGGRPAGRSRRLVRHHRRGTAAARRQAAPAVRRGGLVRALGELVGEDGGVLSRSPIAQMEAIALLIDLRACYRSGGPRAAASVGHDAAHAGAAAAGADPWRRRARQLAGQRRDGKASRLSRAGRRERRAHAPAERRRAAGATSGSPRARRRCCSTPRRRRCASHARHGCASTLAFEFSHGRASPDRQLRRRGAGRRPGAGADRAGPARHRGPFDAGAGRCQFHRRADQRQARHGRWRSRDRHARTVEAGQRLAPPGSRRATMAMPRASA